MKGLKKRAVVYICISVSIFLIWLLPYVNSKPGIHESKKSIEVFISHLKLKEYQELDGKYDLGYYEGDKLIVAKSISQVDSFGMIQSYKELSIRPNQYGGVLASFEIDFDKNGKCLGNFELNEDYVSGKPLITILSVLREDEQRGKFNQLFFVKAKSAK